MSGSKFASAMAVSAILIACTVTFQRMASARVAQEPRAGTFEVYPDKSGDFRWRLVSSNGKVIASSGEGYKDKRDCIAGIDSVKRIAPISEIKELADSPTGSENR